MAARKKSPARKAAAQGAEKKKAAPRKKKAAEMASQEAAGVPSPEEAAAAEPSAKKAPAKQGAARKASAKPKKASAKKVASKKAAAEKGTPAQAPASDAPAADSQPEAAPRKVEPTTSRPATGAPSAAVMPSEPPITPRGPRPAPLPKMPKMPPRRADGTITIACGTTADQTFMIYALATGKVESEGRRYEIVRSDLKRLDEVAHEGTYDVTAISFGAFPAVRARYIILPCGGCYGDNQGPVLVARKPIRAGEVEGLQVAVPGEQSTGAIALRLWLPQARLALQAVPTREISLRVRAGLVRAGLLVNEDQVTYRAHNLVRVVDLGQWWNEKTEGLPLALGANVIRRDIPDDERAKIALDLKRSIAYALGHREEALDWSMQYAGTRTRDTLDKYVSRYVNDLSLDCGIRGRQAATMLLHDAWRHRILDAWIEPDFDGDKKEEEKEEDEDED